MQMSPLPAAFAKHESQHGTSDVSRSGDGNHGREMTVSMTEFESLDAAGAGSYGVVEIVRAAGRDAAIRFLGGVLYG
jgi:hypothetical protein